MSRNAVFATALLAAVWVILTESATVYSVAVGVAIGACCVFVCHKFLPPAGTAHVSIFWLAVYLFYLLWRVYVCSFATIKIILTGAKVDVVQVRTQIHNKLLRTLLANSITLVPGSISLETGKDSVTVLWLLGKNAGQSEIADADESIKGKLERMLLKAQR